MGTGDHNAGGYPCDGLASHPGGIFPASPFMLQKVSLAAPQRRSVYFFPSKFATGFIVTDILSVHAVGKR